MVNLQVIKSADVSYLFLECSNKIIYSIFITNTGNSRANDVKVKDVLCSNASIIPSTVMVDGFCRKLSLTDMSIAIGTIEAGATSILTYEVEVQEDCVEDCILNKAIASYTEEDANCQCQTILEESNLLVIPIIDVDVNVTKTVDKRIAKVNDVLTYSILIRNDSNIAIDNAILNDYIGVELELHPSSVMVNGIAQYVDSLVDLSIGTIEAYSSVLVQFKAKVIALTKSRNIKNVASLDYEYTVMDNGIEAISGGVSCSNEVITRILEWNSYC